MTQQTCTKDERARRRRKRTLAEFVTSVANDSNAARSATTGQLITLGYSRDEIHRLHHHIVDFLERHTTLN